MQNSDTSKPTARFPSFKWMRGVARDMLISVVHRFVLIRLCLYRDEKNNGRCDPGYQTVADELGVDRATVFRAVDVGIRRGWLAGFSKHGGGAKRSFVFTFPDPQQSQGSDGSTVAAQRRSKKPTVAGKRPNSRTRAHQQSQAVLEDVEPAGELAPNGQRERAKRTGSKSQTQAPLFAPLDSGEDATPHPGDFVDAKKPDIHEVAGPKPKPKASDGNLDDNIIEVDPASAFPEFWSAYPKRVAKAQAEKAFAAAIKRGADQSALIDGAKRYAAERAGQDPKYTKHPSTWLNAECWLDETAPTGPVIDQDGNVIETPSPRRSRPQSVEEEAEEILAEIKAGGGR